MSDPINVLILIGVVVVVFLIVFNSTKSNRSYNAPSPDFDQESQAKMRVSEIEQKLKERLDKVYTPYGLSMYGWRVSPPYEYPQKTINTKYDKVFRDCALLCHEPTHPHPGQCFINCSKKAIEHTGFGGGRENFSSFVTSRPSHLHLRHRMTEGLNDESCFHR